MSGDSSNCRMSDDDATEVEKVAEGSNCVSTQPSVRPNRQKGSSRSSPACFDRL
jgi:hypothetical protein